MIENVTPVIITRDEEANIARTIAQLQWAREVVLVDSFSTDRTVAIARSFPNVRIVQRVFDSITGQTLAGIANVSTDWVLMLDADYFVPDQFEAELRSTIVDEGVTAFVCGFTYAIAGKPLRASLYPPRIVLFRRDRIHVWQDGHTPRFETSGKVDRLSSKIIHDDRKPFSRFIARQRRYMREEAVKLRSASWQSLSLPGRVRKMVVVAPIAVLFHTALVKGLLWDGMPGLRYTAERFVAELMLSWELLRPATRASKAYTRPQP